MYTYAGCVCVTSAGVQGPAGVCPHVSVVLQCPPVLISLTHCEQNTTVPSHRSPPSSLAPPGPFLDLHTHMHKQTFILFQC